MVTGKDERFYFNELLSAHRITLQAYKRELEELPEGRLGVRACSDSREGILYCHYIDGSRRGISNNNDLIRSLARKMFLERSIRVMEKNIKYLQKLTDMYENADPAGVIRSFPHHYAVLMDQKEAEWNERKRRWVAAEYERSGYELHRKTHITARGLQLRSKSEVIIAERLDYYDIAYRYEQLLYIGGYSFAPDFTILTQRGKVYWEHCGIVNDKSYMNKHNWKMQMYETGGIVPWKNLIVTYDNEEGHMDTRLIDAEIINKLM